MEYYEYLFFKNNKPVIYKWAIKKGHNVGTESIKDFFRICLKLCNEKDVSSCFVDKMWKIGKERLAIGLNVECYGDRYDTQHMIHKLEKNYFVDENDNKIPYTSIKRLITIPDSPKFSYKNIKVGMKLRLINKRYTGNIYTVIGTSKLGFDVENNKYVFLNLDYDSIDKIIEN